MWCRLGPAAGQAGAPAVAVGSVSGGNAGCDIPEPCSAVFFSVLCQAFFRRPAPALSQMGKWQGFGWTSNAGDPARRDAVFRVTGQDCGSVQEQERCNLGKNKAQGKFGN